MHSIKTNLPANLKAFVLTMDDSAHPLFQQYMEIRDFHYVEKHHWTKEGVDEFDEFSTFVVLVQDNTVLVAGRVVHDSREADLPIRLVLREAGKPTSQIPQGSVEISRFGVNPKLLGTRDVNRLLGAFVNVIADYCEASNIRDIFAVLISILERRFSHMSHLKVERLSDGVMTTHGTSEFHTVRLIPKKWEVNSFLPFQQVA